MKKFWQVLTLTLLFGAVGAGQALALDGTAIYVNNQYLPLDTMPYVSEGTTFVPLRTVSSALGADVSWSNGQANISLSEQGIVLRPNVQTAEVNGTAVELAAAPVVQDGRILVPLRFVSEQLGAGVDYADHVIDITPAAGSVLPDIPSVYTAETKNRVDDDSKYIYSYLGSVTRRINKATLESEVLEIPAQQPLVANSTPIDGYLSALNVVGDKLYFVGRYSQEYEEGQLCVYDLAEGDSAVLLTKAYRSQVYDGWLYYQDTPRYNGKLYRVALIDGKPSGEPQQVAKEVFKYWFVDDTLYYSNWGIKLFRAGLDGQGVEKIIPSYSNVHWRDAGWHYTVANYAGPEGNYSGYPGIYRFTTDPNEKELVYAWPERGDIQNVQVFGDKIYFGSTVSVPYTENGKHWAVASGPLYCVDLDGENLRQLTDCRSSDFYVFRDVMIYYAPDFQEWRVERLDD